MRTAAPPGGSGTGRNQPTRSRSTRLRELWVVDWGTGDPEQRSLTDGVKPEGIGRDRWAEASETTEGRLTRALVTCCHLVTHNWPLPD